MDADALLSHMMHDKKAKDGKLTFVLVRGLGHLSLPVDGRVVLYSSPLPHCGG